MNYLLKLARNSVGVKNINGVIKEIKDRANARAQQVAKECAENEANILHGYLRAEMLNIQHHPYLTGNMASHWDVSSAQRYSGKGYEVLIDQTALNKKGQYYADIEEERHHPVQYVLDNEYKPTTRTRVSGFFAERLSQRGLL